jgi:HSP20 family protein
MADLSLRRDRRDVDRFRGEIDRLFDDFFARSRFGRYFGSGDWKPAIDVSETSREILIHAEVPGMDVDDIDISLNGRILTISGERKQEQEEKEKSYHCIECRYGSFSRSLELPSDIDANQVKAIYKKGILSLNLPKTRERSEKKIDVKTS